MILMMMAEHADYQEEYRRKMVEIGVQHQLRAAERGGPEAMKDEWVRCEVRRAPKEGAGECDVLGEREMEACARCLVVRYCSKRTSRHVSQCSRLAATD